MNLSIEKLRSPRSPRRSSGSVFYQDSNSSTPFVSAPSSPRYYYSAPPSPPRNRAEYEESSSLASVPFSWEERPGTPKKHSGNQMKTSVDHLSAMGFHFSAPVSPQREEFDFMKQMQAADEEFEFTSARISDAESTASMMSHADELFYQGQILPLKLPPRLQQPNQRPSLSLLDTSPRSIENSNFGPRTPRFGFMHQQNSPRGFPPDHRDTSTPKTSSSNLRSAQVNRPKKEASPPSSRSSSIGKSLRELLNINSSSGSSQRSGTESGKSSRSSSGSSQRFSSSRSSSVSSNKSTGSTKSSAKKVNPVSRELLQNYNKNYKAAEELRKKTFLPYRRGLLGCLGGISIAHFSEIDDTRS